MLMHLRAARNKNFRNGARRGPAQASGAIPLRRVGLQSVSRQKPRYVTHRAANEGATRYRIIVVPDDRGLGEEIYLQPASKMPGGIFRDPMEALPTY